MPLDSAGASQFVPSTAGADCPKPSELAGSGEDAGIQPLRKQLVLVSPPPGRNSAQRIVYELTDYFCGAGIKVEFVVTWRGDDLRQSAAEAVQAGYHRVLVVGGDAALRHVVSGAFGHDLEVAIARFDATNYIADWLAIPRDPVAAVRASLTWPARAMDLVCATLEGGREELFFGFAQLGLAMQPGWGIAYPPASASSWRRCLAIAIGGMGQVETPAFELKWDSEELRGRLLLMTIANAAVYGRGMTETGEAKDGLLEVEVVGLLPYWKLFEAVSIMLEGDRLRWPIDKHFQTRQMTLATDPPTAIVADGDLVGNTPVSLRLVPQAVRIVAPPLERNLI